LLFDRMECAEGSLESGSVLGITTGRKSGNGREELAFPAPWEMPSLWSEADSEANVTDFPGAGRTAPSHTTGKSGGERRGTGPAGLEFRTTSREAELRGAPKVERGATADTVGPRPIVATVSQCGGNGSCSPGAKNGLRNPPVSQPARKKRDPPAAG